MTTVFAIHGFTSAPASFEALRSIAPDELRWVCPYVAGHGPNPTSTHSFEAESLRLGALVDELEGDVVVLGYSLGGRLALSLASHPKPSAFVVVGAHLGLANEAERAARRASDASLAVSLRDEGLEPFLESWEALPLFETQRSLPEPVRRLREAIRRIHHATGLANALESLSLGEMPDLRERIAGARASIDFVAGAEDAKFVALAVEGAMLAPRGEAHIVPGVGHDVLLEAPERIAAILERRIGASA